MAGVLLSAKQFPQRVTRFLEKGQSMLYSLKIIYYCNCHLGHENKSTMGIIYRPLPVRQIDLLLLIDLQYNQFKNNYRLFEHNVGAVLVQNQILLQAGKSNCLSALMPESFNALIKTSCSFLNFSILGILLCKRASAGIIVTLALGTKVILVIRICKGKLH